MNTTKTQSGWKRGTLPLQCLEFGRRGEIVPVPALIRGPVAIRTDRPGSYTPLHVATLLSWGRSFRTLRAAKEFCDGVRALSPGVLAAKTSEETAAAAAEWERQNPGWTLRRATLAMADAIRD